MLKVFALVVAVAGGATYGLVAHTDYFGKTCCGSSCLLLEPAPASAGTAMPPCCSNPCPACADGCDGCPLCEFDCSDCCSAAASTVVVGVAAAKPDSCCAAKSSCEAKPAARKAACCADPCPQCAIDCSVCCPACPFLCGPCCGVSAGAVVAGPAAIVAGEVKK